MRVVIVGATGNTGNLDSIPIETLENYIK